ncbi:putative reverse transcriptase domain-containing protein, partial [Tanacetum coccineum]
IVIENPNHLNEPNEAIPEVSPVVPERNQVVNIHDPNKMVDLPDDIYLVDYDEEDPEEDPEEEPEEDVKIELEDDVELIFPYEVEGDKTPPPGDVSSDSELEDEKVDVAPEATVGTINQKPYAIRDFLRGLLEAELGTCQTEIALLKSKNKIGEKERELLNHDLENVERALGNILERMSVLESRENATLKKRLAETETKLVLESVVLEPVCDLQSLKGTEGAVGLCQWFEKLESVFRISDCKERDKVKFATATLQGEKVDDQGILSSKCVAKAGARIPEQVKVEQYIRGLSKNIRGDVTSSRHADKTDEASEDEKRKGEGDHGGHGDNRRDYNCWQNQRRANAGAITNAAPNDNEVCPKCKNKKHVGDCWKCGKCGKLGHKTAACWSLDRKDVTCFKCNEKGHRKRDCPKLKKNGQGGNNRGAIYKLGVMDAQQDPKIVTELGSFDVIIGMDWLSRYDATILFGKKKAKKYIEKGYELFLAQVTKQESKEKQVEFRIDLILGVAPVARAPYRLAPSKMKELSKQLQELSEKGLVTYFESAARFSVYSKIEFTIWLSSTSYRSPMNDLELGYAVVFALRLVEACKEENIGAEGFRGEGEPFEVRSDELEDMYRACVIDFGLVAGLEMPNLLDQNMIVVETTEMIVQIKNRLLAARSRQKSYADVRHKPLEFKVGDKVMLKVSPWKGVV